MYASSIAGIIRIPDSLCCIIIKDFAWLDTVALLPAPRHKAAQGHLPSLESLSQPSSTYENSLEIRPAIRAGALSSIDSLNSPTKYEIARNSVLSESK